MKSLIIALCVAGVLDLIISIVNPNTVLYAGATMASCLIWLMINEKNFSYMLPSRKDILYIVVLLTTFAFCMIIKYILMRILIYIIIYFVITGTMRNDEWDQIIKSVGMDIKKIMHLEK